MAIGTRKITNTRSKKVIGKFPSLKMNTTIMWESQLERDYIYLLEIDTDAVAYCGQPFTIAYDRQNKRKKYTRKKYTPDFLVERKCSKQVVEVKPKSKVESFVGSDRFLGIANFCSINVVTEETIRVQPRLDNIKLLHRFGRSP